MNGRRVVMAVVVLAAAIALMIAASCYGNAMRFPGEGW